jgi:hypothetical protein
MYGFPTTAGASEVVAGGAATDSDADGVGVGVPQAANESIIARAIKTTITFFMFVPPIYLSTGMIPTIYISRPKKPHDLLETRH